MRIDDLVHLLYRKLSENQCMYCQLVFRDGDILREHMRKKKHCKVAERNREFDQFFIVNYTGQIWRMADEIGESDNEKR